MNIHHGSLPFARVTSDTPDTERAIMTPSSSSSHTPTGNGKKFPTLTSFWRERFFEGGLILSMLLYYIVGNPKLQYLYIAPLGPLPNELIAFPFLVIFAILCWYRLPMAIALLPLTLPFYLLQRAIVGDLSFSLAEVALAVCLIVAALRLLLQQHDQLSWSQLRERIGSFFWPVIVFCGVAALSILIAYNHRFALRAFHEEVAAPLLYLGLALLYLRSRQDLLRLLVALFGTGLLVAFIGLGQGILFYPELKVQTGGFRIYAMYGSANSIGLLFDYVMPLGLAYVCARVAPKRRLLALGACVVMLVALCLTFSGGSWLALSVATIFIVALSLRNRRLLIWGSVALVFVVAVVGLVFHTKIEHFILTWHAASSNGLGSIVKRFFLWQSAWQMIQHSPWLGYGLDNWLCHYSVNSACPSTLHHYWILIDPVSGKPTGLNSEPDLSHPHNIFLHIWFSMGIFGLLAFIAVLFLFFRLFARMLKHLSVATIENSEQLRWMTLGVGAGMLAAMVQGIIDSAFLEQDLAFCFWMLVAALLLLRIQAGIPWKRVFSTSRDHPR
jgi:putative inorganic carbon (HCO3(-)) transporter